MWGVLLLVIWSIASYLTSDKQLCGWDDVYDNNCGEFYD